MFCPLFFAALAAGEVKEDARSDAGKEKARQDHTQRIPATLVEVYSRHDSGGEAVS